MTVRCGQRISVIGTSGSGKTTTASRIARRLEIPHVELDALHWEPDWTPAPLAVFRERVAQALSGETWTVDGNYLLQPGQARSQILVNPSKCCYNKPN